MNATFSIMRRELGAYFTTPIGYVVMAAFLLVTSSFYVATLFQQGQAEMRAYFSSLPFLLLLFVPAVSMRLWAEERKLGTLEVLLTMPIKTWQAVLGKFLAGMTFIALWFVLTLDKPLMLAWLGNPDYGQILGSYLGAMVLAMVYLSIGCFASSLTSDQIIALVVGMAINLVFFLMGVRPILDWIKDVCGASVANTVERFGVDYHFESISRGVVDTRDVVYALTLTGFFLLLNVLVIERRR